MRKCHKSFRANKSGQLLIVAALAIAVLISSTTLYVYELSQKTGSGKSFSVGDSILALKQETNNAVMSSLVNVSNGGENAVLSANLNELSETVSRLRHSGMFRLDFALLNDSPYDSGIWISWNTQGTAISGAYANFTLHTNGETEETTTHYAINTTTVLALNGSYIALSGEERLVSLTLKLDNDGESAAVRDCALFYDDGGGWLYVNTSENLSVFNYGNGTYFFSFVVTTASNQLSVVAQVHDLRGVYVEASTTCSNQ